MEPSALNKHLTHPTSGYPDPETEVSWLVELCPQELEEGACNQVLMTLVFKSGVFGETSLMAQWLRLHTHNAGDSGSIPYQGGRFWVAQ